MGKENFKEKLNESVRVTESITAIRGRGRGRI